MFILLDLDGTLIDSRPGIIASFEYALERLGAPRPADDILDACLGPPLRASFAELLATSDLVTIEHAVDCYRERYAVVGVRDSRVYEGVPEMLAALTASHQVAIATSKARPFAEAMVTHFGLDAYLTRVFGAELDSVGNKSDLVADILQALELTPRETVMVGDREHDIIAARDHGLRTIGVTYGFGSPEELLSAGADALASKPMDVATLCARWCPSL